MIKILILIIHLMLPPYDLPLWQMIDNTRQVDTASSLIIIMSTVNMMIIMSTVNILVMIIMSMVNTMVMISMIRLMISMVIFIVGEVNNLNIEVWIPLYVCMGHCNN